MRKKEYRGLFAPIQRWNFARVERRRWQRTLNEAIPENDAALLEGVTRLLERATASAGDRAAWEAADTKRGEALAARIEDGRVQLAGVAAGVERLSSRLADAAAESTKLAALVGKVSVQAARLAHQGSLGAPDGPAGAAALPRPDPFPVISTARYGLLEPELDLIVDLAPSLSPKTALDVGAHHGLFSEVMLAAGFEVHALEPNPQAFAELERRLGGRPGFSAYPVAASSEEGEGQLGLLEDPTGTYTDPTQFASLAGLAPPPGLVRTGSVQVPVRRLDALVQQHAIRSPSLVKIDAEGLDLEVMRGLGVLRPGLLLVEFWDEALPFSGPGAKNRVPDLVALAREMGMLWHLVIFRRWGDDRAAFYTSRTGSPERSWGNVLFFADHALYERARRLMAITLPEARFVAVR